jgi:dihydroflavonol-4-reductase
MAEPLPGPLLITGATGFVGGTLVRRLVRAGVDGAHIRCLVRDRARAARLGLPPESLREGDLGDPAGGPALAAAAAGAATVVHIAGTLHGNRRRDFDLVNVDGTARLIDALRSVGGDGAPPHVVCVSSLAAAGPSTDGATSAVPPDRATPVSWYGDSKRRGELAVVGSGLPFTILRPPVVYGPGDAATRLLFGQARAVVTAVPPRPRPLSAIHVDDVVTAVLAALRVRPPGTFLPLDGPQRTDTHALLRAIAAACGRRPRLLPVPMWLARAAAAAADVWAQGTGRSSFFNRDKMRELGACGWVADGTMAREHLGFVPAIALEDGLAAIARSEGFGRPA